MGGLRASFESPKGGGAYGTAYFSAIVLRLYGFFAVHLTIVSGWLVSYRFSLVRPMIAQYNLSSLGRPIVVGGDEFTAIRQLFVVVTLSVGFSALANAYR